MPKAKAAAETLPSDVAPVANKPQPLEGQKVIEARFESAITLRGSTSGYSFINASRPEFQASGLEMALDGGLLYVRRGGRDPETVVVPMANVIQLKLGD